MEEAVELGNYLPLSFNSPKEQEYIAFLWDTFEINYEHGKYQFAFLAYHMLTMSFIYFNLWQIRQARQQIFLMAMVGFNKELEKELIDATSPFTFWRVNESNVFRFLKLIGCDNVQIGSYTALVKERNNTAHPNGIISFSTQAALDSKIAEILRVVNEIESHSQCVIEECYREFLLKSYDPEEREYTDPTDQIREELIHKNYFSQKDVEFCLSFKITSLADHLQYDNILELHNTLVTQYEIEFE